MMTVVTSNGGYARVLSVKIVEGKAVIHMAYGNFIAEEVREATSTELALAERNAELERQISDATEAMDELYASVDSYYIEKGQVSTPKHLAYMEKWKQTDEQD